MSNNNNNNNNNADYSKKDEYRKYLEKQGVLDAITKVLVGLYEEPERPTNALQYVRQMLGAPQNIDVEGLRRENEQLKQELAALKRNKSENGK